MRRLPPFAALAVLFAFVVSCSWLGIDFGTHWDEYAQMVKPVLHSIRQHTILPIDYIYPSLLHETLLVSLLPHLGRGDLAAWVDSHAFMLYARRITSLLAALSVIWVFLAVWASGRGGWEALAAAAILAGSWEVQYHSRWLTVDPLMMMLGAGTLMFAVLAHVRQSPALLRAAAVAAGLACGAKYTGGALLLPVIIAALSMDRVGRRIAELVAIFAATFFVTTPGMLLHPAAALHDVELQMSIYSSGWRSYTVPTPSLHARLLGEYLALVMLSRYAPIAGGLFALAVAGAVALYREERQLAIVVLSFPVAFSAYFAIQRVMIVRNVLVLAPFLALLAARGIGWMLREVARSRATRSVAACGIALMLLINLVWIARAAWSIRAPGDPIRELAAWLDEQSDRRIALSPRVLHNLGIVAPASRPALSPLDPTVEDVVFYARDVPESELVANRRCYATRWFGPYEVNWNYYPAWMGEDRIVVMPREHYLWRVSYPTGAARSGSPSMSTSWIGYPSAPRGSRTCAALPTITMSARSGSMYFCATRAMSALPMAPMFSRYLSK